MAKLPREIQARPLYYFVSLYDSGCFAKAAEELCITQPALSNSIQNLEKRLQVKLFDRTSQGVLPTAYATALYRRAKLSRAELVLAVEEIERLKNCTVGTARIGVGPSMLGTMSRVLARILGEKPQLEVTVIEGPAEPLIREIEAGSLDLVVCTTARSHYHPDLHIEIMAMLPTVPIVHVDHLLARTEFEWARLVDYPWIIADSSLEPATKDLLYRLPVPPPRTIIATNSHTLMKMIVKGSNFICFMPKMLLMFGDYAGTLTAIGPKSGVYERPLVLITRKRSLLPPLSEAIAQALREAVEELDIG